jgi:hypothetical protein
MSTVSKNREGQTSFYYYLYYSYNTNFKNYSGHQGSGAKTSRQLCQPST